MRVPCDCYAIIMWVLRYLCLIIMWLVCEWYGMVMLLLCECVITMWVL